MKIAFAHDSINTEGGVESYLLSVILELRARGHQVALVYHWRNTSRSPLRSSAHLALGVEERGINSVVEELRKWGPDVCYSHNMGPLEVDRHLLGERPVVKMLHGYFGTCISGLKMHAFPSAHACHRTFGASCLALYFPRHCGQLSPRAMMRGYRWSREQRTLFSRYSAVVVASRHMGDEIARHGVARDRIAVLPLFSTVKGDRGMWPGEPDTVLFGGRMTSLKGGDVLIDAASIATRLLGRPVRLVFAGEGPQKDEWRSLAAKQGVQAEFTGWVDFEERQRIYGRSVLVAVPSLWPEPFGLIGLDAAALGRPAVAFDVGGIRDWLTDGVNGRLVKPSAGAQGLAEAMVAVLGSPSVRHRMGQAALEVARRMTVGAHVNGLEEVLRNAVSGADLGRGSPVAARG
jgi:glycosyltransferase involved in cell wall biosynthesis